MLSFYSQQSHGERTSGYVCLLPNRTRSYHSSVQHVTAAVGRCVRVICAFSSSPAVFLRCHTKRPGDDTVSSVCRVRVFPRKTRSSPFRPAYERPRRFLMQTEAGLHRRAGASASRALWQLDEVHIDPVQVSPTSTSPRSFSCAAVKQIAPAYLNSSLRSSERFIP